MLYNLLSKNIRETDTEFKKKYLILINKYLFIVSILYFFSLTNMLIHLICISKVLLYGISALGAFIIIQTRKLINSNFFFLSHIFVITLFSYCSIKVNLSISEFIYIITFMVSTPIFFSIKKDKLKILILIIYIVLSRITVLIINDYNSFLYKLPTNFIIANNIISVLFLLNSLYFLNSRFNLYIFKAIALENRNKKSDEDLRLMMESAKINDPNFMVYFSKLHNDLYSDLLKKFPELSKNDLKYCALIYLGFSTKDIQNNLNVSIRTVENIKYNLRKKLNLENENLYTFLNKMSV